MWYNETLEEGNYWSDFEDNPGYPDVYIIPGDGDNVDLYPLTTPYNPLPDLLVTEFYAEFISLDHDSLSRIEITALIMNNGTDDITRSFQVSFYGISESTGIDAIDTEIGDSVCIGTVEISSLDRGKTAEVTIYWVFRPQVHTLSVLADDTGVIEESNEHNNRARIALPTYPLWKSLNETINVYSELIKQFEAPSAEDICIFAEDALSVEAYLDPEEYVESMETIAEIEHKVGSELEGQIPEVLLQEYLDAVERLQGLIDDVLDNDPSSTHEVTWDDAGVVAEVQLQICELVSEMIPEKPQRIIEKSSLTQEPREIIL